jgi:cytochrome c peroxidase
VKEGIENFTEQESKGYELFKTNCSSCHTEPLFSNYQFANNGLGVDSTLNDFGKWNITKKSSDSLKFKIPSLRNLSYSFPYMHDGRFKKLNHVLNHYTKEIIESPTLAPELKKGISLSSDEKTDLIAFLLTLNDKNFVFNSDFQYPKNILGVGEGNSK